MPPEWAAKAEMRELPSDPALESEFAYWIEELGAWIAMDESEAKEIRKTMPAGEKLLLVSDLEERER